MKLKTLTLFTLLIFVCTTPAYAWLSGYAHRRIITVQDTNVDGNLTDFPTYVKVADTEMSQLIDTSTFYDIRFTNTSDTILDYECEFADATIGHYWVKTASILASGGATIYMYYENSGSQTDGSGDPWDANFLFVLHMSDEPASSGTMSDSAGTNDFTWIDGDSSSDTSATGQIYKCVEWSNSVGDYLTGPAGLAEDTMTITWWMNQDVAEAPDVFFMDRNGWDTAAGLFICSWTGDDMVIRGTGIPGFVSGTVIAGSFKHLGITYSGADGEYFVNGSSDTAGAVTQIVGNTHATLIGVYGDESTVPMDGHIDEVRWSSVVRADEWINFEYHNIAEADNELDFAAEENAPVVGGMTDVIILRVN